MDQIGFDLFFVSEARINQVHGTKEYNAIQSQRMEWKNNRLTLCFLWSCRGAESCVM
ncbi:hypothetical protein Bca101_042866 [Brassica carinata]